MEQQTKNKSLILIVDDVEINRFLLGNIIEDMGHEYIMAENGLEALHIFHERNPRLVLLDISMPEMDGYEFCKIIKANPHTRDVPVIFISAHDAASAIVKGFNMGGDDYITKPFIPEVVKARVKMHLGLYQAHNELKEHNRKLHASVNEQLQQMELEKKSVLYGLANVVRKNSCYAELHMEKLGYNCRILAQAMQFSPHYERVVSDTYIETIELAAPLCDVGNVTVPMEILQKDGLLTEQEMEIMKTHTTFGGQLLQDIANCSDYNDFMMMSVEIAQNHHENWDGSGYPTGKSGNEIPLSAQVVALISAYCALTEPRKYREAYSKEEALDILEKDVGVKFSEHLFRICRKVSRQLR